MSRPRTTVSHDSSSTSTAASRLQNIANHMATPTSFPASAVPQAPEDPLFGLMRAYRADDSKDKVDLVGLPPVHPLKLSPESSLLTFAVPPSP